jgi:hypothetical protein
LGFEFRHSLGLGLELVEEFLTARTRWGLGTFHDERVADADTKRKRALIKYLAADRDLRSGSVRLA